MKVNVTRRSLISTHLTGSQDLNSLRVSMTAMIQSRLRLQDATLAQFTNRLEKAEDKCAFATDTQRKMKEDFVSLSLRTSFNSCPSFMFGRNLSTQVSPTFNTASSVSKIEWHLMWPTFKYCVNKVSRHFFYPSSTLLLLDTYAMFIEGTKSVPARRQSLSSESAVSVDAAPHTFGVDLHKAPVSSPTPLWDSHMPSKAPPLSAVQDNFTSCVYPLAAVSPITEDFTQDPQPPAPSSQLHDSSPKSAGLASCSRVVSDASIMEASADEERTFMQSGFTASTETVEIAVEIAVEKWVRSSRQMVDEIRLHDFVRAALALARVSVFPAFSRQRHADFNSLVAAVYYDLLWLRMLLWSFFGALILCIYIVVGLIAAPSAHGIPPALPPPSSHDNMTTVSLSTTGSMLPVYPATLPNVISSTSPAMPTILPICPILPICLAIPFPLPLLHPDDASSSSESASIATVSSTASPGTDSPSTRRRNGKYRPLFETGRLQARQRRTEMH